MNEGIKIKKTFIEPKISEGEVFLREYFNDENIHFIPQPKIDKLNGDTKAFRIADFYLKKYKVYVEFNGQWNQGEEHRERYVHKTYIYKQNNIPCIFLYPDNLGIIDHIFHKRLTEVLKKHGYKKELLRWRLKKIWKEEAGNIIGFLFFIFIAIHSFISPLELKIGIICLCISFFLLIKFGIGIRNIFKE